MKKRDILSIIVYLISSVLLSIILIISPILFRSVCEFVMGVFSVALVSLNIINKFVLASINKNQINKKNYKIIMKNYDNLSANDMEIVYARIEIIFVFVFVIFLSAVSVFGFGRFFL